jgi:glucose-6-phosphate isomerase
VARHFAALTTNVQAAAEFGIQRTFGFWDWVGGRYSLWSAIGLPIAIAVGAAGFRELLAGAHAMDEHFRTAPLEGNLPVRLALLDVWYRDFHGFASRSVAPYHSALRRLPAYLQQLEMESNGKRVDRRAACCPSPPRRWSGASRAPTASTPTSRCCTRAPTWCRWNSSPCASRPHAARAPSATAGQRAGAGAGADAGQERPGRPQAFPRQPAQHHAAAGRLEPASLGALIALYEHRVFCAGALWGINSFDQWGVELGKVLAKDIAPRLPAVQRAHPLMRMWISTSRSARAARWERPTG